MCYLWVGILGILAMVMVDTAAENWLLERYCGRTIHIGCSTVNNTGQMSFFKLPPNRCTVRIQVSARCAAGTAIFLQPTSYALDASQELQILDDTAPQRKLLHRIVGQMDKADTTAHIVSAFGRTSSLQLILNPSSSTTQKRRPVVSLRYALATKYMHPSGRMQFCPIISAYLPSTVCRSPQDCAWCHDTLTTPHCDIPIKHPDNRALAATLNATIISCSATVPTAELLSQVQRAARQPIRPAGIFLTDHAHISSRIFHPIAAHVAVLLLRNCQDSRTTGKLADLQFNRLLRFHLSGCRQLDVRRDDFVATPEVRMIAFQNTTIKHLEQWTFMDLPYLQALSLEFGARAGKAPSTADYKYYLNRLHCGCEFEWFRQWMDRNPRYIQSKAARAVYHIDNSWTNDAFPSSMLHSPFICRRGGPTVGYKSSAFSLGDNPCLV
ncbi:uncharacterized protein LOC129585577 [Paramacrobiotus metropolitanus]|uniref:uncharacterized protein LOC129585577 n=1 Tax=Paramacrobiotus metropolitanus TaxID=2943436 RepID=UPI0024459403|nr:uncharacterized protein LOC129585577 [Paramacrobiotus metropolitanus]XP_055334276.1 uncharacterized protein LOC129585577 [Paramacrobiotus metropolitanus]XP_055334278.1 uncharacterized protein LOC129585577 [Paramacrobiotus metropolitanus]